jgi:hypothetical protein
MTFRVVGDPMTFAESLALLEKLKVAGGQAHTDSTNEHEFHSVSLDLDAVTRIEFSVRVQKHPAPAYPGPGHLPCDYGE